MKYTTAAARATNHVLWFVVQMFVWPDADSHTYSGMIISARFVFGKVGACKNETAQKNETSERNDVRVRNFFTLPISAYFRCDSDKSAQAEKLQLS